MEEFNNFLISIGLGKNEALVYDALVELNSSSVLQLSKKTKLHRSNIYDSLRKLIQRGLVYEINESGTKTFAARPPQSLSLYLKQKEIELGDIISRLNKPIKEVNENVFKVSRGMFAMRQALFSFLDVGKPIRVMGIPTQSTHLIGPVLKEFHKERINRKQMMYHIYNSDSEERAKIVKKMKYTDARVSPKRFDTVSTTNICGDRVFLVLWEEEIIVIEIFHKEIARTTGNYFDALWSKSKKV